MARAALVLHFFLTSPSLPRSISILLLPELFCSLSAPTGCSRVVGAGTFGLVEIPSWSFVLRTQAVLSGLGLVLYSPAMGAGVNRMHLEASCCLGDAKFFRFTQKPRQAD